MQATTFEYRHQTALHLLLVGLASLTYLVDRVDIVWGLVQNHSNSASWERWVFGCGALMLLGSAVLETWANAPERNDTPRRSVRQTLLARILTVLAIGLLLPPSGTIILLVGETILIQRLAFRERAGHISLQAPPQCAKRSWGSAFRIAASKWGLTVSMIVFVCTLRDRLAEIGALSSVILWLVLNVPMRKLTIAVDR